MNWKFLLPVATALLAFIPFSSGAQTKASSDITLCPLKVPKSIKQASANFLVSYSFELDENGQPVGVKKIKNDYVERDEVLSCLADWRIIGFPKDSQFTTIFKWKHGRGWVEMMLIGPTYNATVRIKEGLGLLD